MRPISLTIAMLLVSWYAFPHGGRLNSEGCHNDRKTGSYHCHRPFQPSTYQANISVARVIDGDTLEVLQNGSRERVRLKEIDAPEMSQPGGIASKKHLQRLVKGNDVQLIGTERDRYQRIL